MDFTMPAEHRSPPSIPSNLYMGGHRPEEHHHDEAGGSKDGGPRPSQMEMGGAGGFSIPQTESSGGASQASTTTNFPSCSMEKSENESPKNESVSSRINGVTVIVDVDDVGQKLTIQSNSKPEKFPEDLESSKPSVFYDKFDSLAWTSRKDRPKRLECVGNHFPELMPEKMSKICFVCSYVTAYSKRKPNGKMVTRHETRYWCPDCRVPLCITPRSCFRRYHTEEEYYMDIEEKLYTNSLCMPQGLAFKSGFSSASGFFPPTSSLPSFPSSMFP